MKRLELQRAFQKRRRGQQRLGRDLAGSWKPVPPI
jgi:hypothetical protein